MWVIAAIILWVISLLVLGAVIKGAIDSSKTSNKLDELIVEVQMLKREIRESKLLINDDFNRNDIDRKY